MYFIDKIQVDEALGYKSLIKALEEGFCADIKAPPRHHHDFKNPKECIDSTLLLMPAWQESESLGIKVITVSPNNTAHNLPSIQGVYLYIDAHLGDVQAVMDAKALTAKRTAAASALASFYLSREDASTLLVVGTGALCPEFIKAHSCVRNITKVYVWGRSEAKAQHIVETLKSEFDIEVVTSLEEGCAKADIISCITLSQAPLVLGSYLKEGVHVDLVGSYKPDMREVDDDAIAKSEVFIDTKMALKESGDLLTPLENGVLKEEDIRASLYELCKKEHKGREHKEQITLFKSVGHALEDLVAAKEVMKNIKRSM